MPNIIFIALVVGYGLKYKGNRRYWKLSISALIVHTLTFILLSGGGTLSDPRGDGLITQFLRQYFMDGSEMVFVGIVAILLGWVLPIYIFIKAVKFGSSSN